MLTSWSVAIVHLLALGIGLGAIWTRARALGTASTPGAVGRILTSDNWWGLAAALWLSTGLWRAFGGLEKGTAYYLAHPLFHAKLALFLIVFGLEIAPMRTFIRWRRQLGRGEPPDTTGTRRLATISYVQVGLIVAIVTCAAGIARGYGF